MFYYIKNNTLFLQIYLQPNAKTNKIIGIHDERLKIQIKSLPIDNKANKELIQFLSQTLNIKRSNIEIVTGNTSRNKLVAIYDTNTNLSFFILKLISTYQTIF